MALMAVEEKCDAADKCCGAKALAVGRNVREAVNRRIAFVAMLVLLLEVVMSKEVRCVLC